MAATAQKRRTPKQFTARRLFTPGRRNAAAISGTKNHEYVAEARPRCLARLAEAAGRPLSSQLDVDGSELGWTELGESGLEEEGS